MFLNMSGAPRKILLRTVTLLPFVVAPLVVARAQEEYKVPRVLSPDGGEACYGRVYDNQHMRTHLRQKVVRIFLLYGSDPRQRPNEEPDSDQSSNHYTGYLMTTLRDAKKPDWAWASCDGGSEDENKRIRCNQECDRTLGYLAPDGKGGIILSDLDSDLYHGPGELDGIQSPADQAKYDKKTLGQDDSKFRLDPSPLETCKAEFAKINAVNPALGEPLRKRLKPDQPFCYGRDYDAAHLAKHPEQMTVSIRVQRGPTELSAYAAANKSESWPEGAEVVVTLTTRKGAGRAEQKYTCSPEADQWRCAAKTPTAAVSTPVSCDVSWKEIFLRRGVDGTMMLGNPNSGLLIGDICAKSAATKSDDKVFRLSPLPLSACGL